MLWLAIGFGVLAGLFAILSISERGTAISRRVWRRVSVVFVLVTLLQIALVLKLF